MSNTELDDLESGIVSAFWTRVCQMVDTDWGPEGYAEKVSRVVQEPDDKLVVDKLRQLAALRDEAMRFRRWPQDRIDVLSNKADMTPPSIAEKVMRLRVEDVQRAGSPRRGRG